MKLYLWQRLEKLTWHWHEEGGLVVVARDREHAEALIEEATNASDYSAAIKYGPTADEWEEAIVYELVGSPEPAVFVFPDKGCC